MRTHERRKTKWAIIMLATTNSMLKRKKHAHARIQSACDEWKCNTSNSFYAHQQHVDRRTYSFRWWFLISLLVVHLTFGSKRSDIDMFVANLKTAIERGPRNNECITLRTRKSYIWANYFLNTKIDYEAKQQCNNKLGIDRVQWYFSGTRFYE